MKLNPEITPEDMLPGSPAYTEAIVNSMLCAFHRDTPMKAIEDYQQYVPNYRKHSFLHYETRFRSFSNWMFTNPDLRKKDFNSAVPKELVNLKVEIDFLESFRSIQNVSDFEDRLFNLISTYPSVCAREVTFIGKVAAIGNEMLGINHRLSTVIIEKAKYRAIMKWRSEST